MKKKPTKQSPNKDSQNTKPTLPHTYNKSGSLGPFNQQKYAKGGLFKGASDFIHNGVAGGVNLGSNLIGQGDAMNYNRGAGGNLFKGAQELGNNAARAYADTTLTTLGASDVIQDSNYKGAGAKFGSGYSNVVGGIGKTVLPTALQAAGVPAPITMAAQQGIGMAANSITEPNMNDIPKLAYGGSMYNGQPNAEIESQEMVQHPDGTTEQADGPTHQSGGVPVNLPNGARIFSDRLKAFSGKTFAKESEKYDNTKYEKTLKSDKVDLLKKKTAAIMFAKNSKALDGLFNEQEMLKQAKVAKYAEKMGLPSNKFAFGGYHNTGNTNTQFNELHPNIGKPQHVYNTHYKDNNTFAYGGNNTIAPILKNGGQLPMYPNGVDDFVDDNTLDPGMQGMVDQWGNVVNNTSFNNLPNTSQKTYPLGSPQNPNVNYFVSPYQVGAKPSSFVQPALPGNYQNNSPNIQGSSYNNVTPPTTQGGQNFLQNPQVQNAAFQLGNAAVQNFGNIRDIRKTKNGTAYDKVDYGNIKPSLLNSRMALTDADTQAAIIQDQIRNASGGASGRTLSNLLASQTVNTINKNRIREQYDNANAGITNQTNMFNKGNQIAGMRDEAANKGRTEDIARNDYNNIGINVASQSKDIRQGNMDQFKASMLPGMYSAINNDPEMKAIWQKKYPHMFDGQGNFKG